MSIPLLSASQFVNTVLATPERGLAYLVGSPIAYDEGGGVPGVGGLIDIMREVASEEDFVSESAFYDTLPETEDAGEMYRAAMGWWGDEGGGIPRINQIVRRAVMRACLNPEALGDPPTGDGAPDDWYLPRGVRDLAALVRSGEEKFAGPILTTNFDPLLELAIQAEGGLSIPESIDYRDGSIREFSPEEQPVIHLHGFWRKSDTLNTAPQLGTERPKLTRSLERLLRHRRLVVVSYGGWNDVFTRALIKLIQTEGLEVDVVWGFYEDDPETIERKYADLIEGVRPEIGNRFKAYGGVDAHTVFGEMVGHVRKKRGERIQLAMQGEDVAEADVEEASLLNGWRLVDDAFLGSLPELSPAEVIRYFDGAVPSWHHALSDAIPRRRHIQRLLNELREAEEQGGASSLHLIEAAAGEGKSTLLLQTAVDAARRYGWRVLARPTATLRLDPDKIEALDPDVQWLLVADDAESLARRPDRHTPSDLEACAERLHARGRSNVHFLLAARDTDWRWTGRKVAWEDWLRFRPPPPLVLRGVTAADAEQIVSAWEQQGTDALGALAEVDAGARAETFRQAVEASGRGREKGSLLGGLLEARLGAAGLRAHVRSLLARLQTVPVQGSSRSLYDALVFIAACHCGRGPGLSLNVLADLLGIDRAWVGSTVMRPLGEEAAAVGGAESAWTRHPRVAEAVIAEVEESFDTDLAEVWAAIVRQTLETRRDVWVPKDSFVYVAHAGPHLVKDLTMLSPARRGSVAVAAARASTSALPGRLDVIVSLARTLRKLRQPAEGAALLRTHLDSAPEKADYRRVIRGYWNEWGTCEGEAGNSASAAVIQSASVSDLLNPMPLDSDRIALSFSGAGKAFERLVKGKCDVWGYALRGASTIGVRSVNAKREHFDYSHRRCDRLGIPKPRDLPEAVEWFEAGVRAAHRLLEDAELASLAAPDAVTFLALRAHLGIADDIGGQSATKPRPKKPRPPRRDREPADGR
ncbi:SIR2 family protein [Rubrivirga sp.]|uniref:P-loop NTPase n=1 Tax=Rubrivirga sp. TaxID=1885344 RepID=UPI003B528A62